MYGDFQAKSLSSRLGRSSGYARRAIPPGLLLSIGVVAGVMLIGPLLSSLLVEAGAVSVSPVATPSARLTPFFTYAITSVTGINSSHLAGVIIIHGQYFGRRPGQLTSVLGGGSDFNACGRAGASLEILDHGAARHNWSAGRETCLQKDHIGVNFHGWNQTTIVLFGLATGYLGNPADIDYWNMSPGDPIQVLVFLQRGPTLSFNVTAL